MKSLLFGFLIVAALPAFADSTSPLGIYCTTSTSATCEQRVLVALDKMACSPLTETAACQESQSLPGVEICTVVTTRCQEPRAGLVLTTSCDNNGEKVSLREQDKGLTLTWWMGFGPYIHDVCRN
jgi:hypothetical protein